MTADAQAIDPRDQLDVSARRHACPTASRRTPAKVLALDPAAVAANKSALDRRSPCRDPLTQTLPPRPFRLAGGAAVALAIAALIVTLFWAILAAAAAAATSAAHLDLGYLIYITTLQAALSTVLSLLVGIALAWALNRLRFPGRGLVIALFAAAIVTPGLVVAFGLLDVWGRAGWLGAP